MVKDKKEREENRVCIDEREGITTSEEKISPSSSPLLLFCLALSVFIRNEPVLYMPKLRLAVVLTACRDQKKMVNGRERGHASVRTKFK